MSICSIYEEDGVWKIADVDENYQICVMHEGTENEMFEVFDEIANNKIDLQISMLETQEEMQKYYESLDEEDEEDEEEYDDDDEDEY